MELEVNGKKVSLEVPNEMPLLWALRDELNLTGTKYGCGISACGACTVHLDGQPIRSCLTPAGSAVGKKITTIEGLNSQIAQEVRDAWVRLDVAQCGYCQSGQVMAAVALLTQHKNPTDQQIDSALSGNICRCGTYNKVREAIHTAAQSLSKV